MLTQDPMSSPANNPDLNISAVSGIGLLNNRIDNLKLADFENESLKHTNLGLGGPCSTGSAWRAWEMQFERWH